ncbi:protein MCM10 homolog [Anopheles ziemanni]|uniref:protein MCM10 homolog n=1 Tax=Anopheles coustani TaxID=139045 RepID=UPI00265ADCBC|nr:protein MCM10 homolog [Anopheles coustani]XP_058167747.1 protein MCM10 homolog [Anopheles ziemanni]
MAEAIEELEVDELEQLLLDAYEDNTDEENSSAVPRSGGPVDTPKPKLTTEGSSFLLGDTENTASGSSNRAAPETDDSVAAMIRDADVDSSDDEETRNFFERKYNQYGRQINDLLKSKEEEKSDQALSKWVDNKLRQINRATAQPPAPVRSPEEEGKKTLAVAKPSVPVSPGGAARKDLPANKIPAVFEATVHTDPIFGMRIVHPLVSSQMLQEHMKEKKAVPFVRLRNFVETADLEQDWVIGGVLVSKSPTKTTSKGKQFAIWKLSDLHGDIKMVTLFLFGSAYKDLWKTADGTVVAVLNPNVLNGNNEKNSEATLSIDRATKVMILGQSRDLGKCRSRKKNGDRCTAIVNLGKCEYCVYHIKQEYGKACNRGGILTSTGGQGLNGLRNKVLGKNEVFYAGQSFSAIKAVKHPKQMEKDRNRMLTLSDYYRSPFEGSGGGSETGTVASSPSSVPSYRRTGSGPTGSSVTPKGSAARVEVNVDQRKKDMERLQSLGVSLESFKAGQQSVSSPRTQTTQQAASLGAVSQTPASSTSTPANPLANRKFSLESVPRLSRTSFDIEFTKQMPTLKALQSRARATAILKEKPAEKSNPNFIKYRGTEQGKKRVLEEVAKNAPLSEENAAKRQKVDKAVEDEAERARKEHMKRIIEATSSHQDLVVARENEQQEEYFKTLERKEAMEEKMLNTFKVACKAVSCRQCKYIAFSAADRCKSEGHQLRVHDAEKRFFRCADCGGRTVSLFRIPKVSCKACQGSRWERCAMMREKRGVQIGDVLSIRGDEEKYLGSLAGASASLNLLMPEEN